MRKWLVLMVMVAFGLMFLGAGCAKPNKLEATDRIGTSITVTWVWSGMITKVTPKTYVLKRATSPLPGAAWSTVYGPGTATAYTDTAPPAAVCFYKVQAFDKSSSPSDVSWPEGGSTNAVPLNPAGSLVQLQTWEKAGNCVHVWTENIHPNPASELPIIDEIHDGSVSGTLTLNMYLTVSGGIDAVADFKFNNFKDTCTNNLLVVDGWQYAPVDVVNYDGFMYGYSDYGAAGWQSYQLIVDNKHSAGGLWYVKDGANPVAMFTEDQSPWGGCVSCATHPSCGCP